MSLLQNTFEVSDSVNGWLNFGWEVVQLATIIWRVDLIDCQENAWRSVMKLACNCVRWRIRFECDLSTKISWWALALIVIKQSLHIDNFHGQRFDPYCFSYLNQGEMFPIIVHGINMEARILCAGCLTATMILWLLCGCGQVHIHFITLFLNDKIFKPTKTSPIMLSVPSTFPRGQIFAKGCVGYLRWFW